MSETFREFRARKDAEREAKRQAKGKKTRAQKEEEWQARHPETFREIWARSAEEHREAMATKNAEWEAKRQAKQEEWEARHPKPERETFREAMARKDAEFEAKRQAKQEEWEARHQEPQPRRETFREAMARVDREQEQKQQEKQRQRQERQAAREQEHQDKIDAKIAAAPEDQRDEVRQELANKEAIGFGIALGAKAFGVSISRKHATFRVNLLSDPLPFPGATAEFDPGNAGRRITATRMALTGPFALALQKDTGNSYLIFTAADGRQDMKKIDPKNQQHARRFAMDFTNAARAAQEALAAG